MTAAENLASDAPALGAPAAFQPAVAAHLPVDSRALDDEALCRLTEAELERLVSALQAGSIDTAQHELTADGEIVSDPRAAFDRHGVPREPAFGIGAEDLQQSPGSTVSSGVKVLVVVSALCVALLLGLVLKAEDPCGQRLEQRCGLLRMKLDAAEHERDALRGELQATVTDRERLNQEVERLRHKSPCTADTANNTGPPAVPVGQMTRELSQVLPLPEANCKACAPCPALEEASSPCPPSLACEPCPSPKEASADDSDMQAQIRLLERDNEYLRGQPERLLEDFHRQSQEIWRLRDELAKATQPKRKHTYAGDAGTDDDSWVQRAQTEGTQLRYDLGRCNIELAKAQEVRQKMLQLLSPPAGLHNDEIS